MFSKFTAISLISLTLMPTSVVSSPGLAQRGWYFALGNHHAVSFDNWGGHASLSNYDAFYGVDDFAHSTFEQVVVQQEEVVCHAQAIEVIQQRLVELAKRVIAELIRAVPREPGGGFSHDLRRTKSATTPSSRATFFEEDHGALSVSIVAVGGHNWNDNTSPASVNSAYFATWNAYPHSF
ncbi:hypothetical protein BDZ89DRAFT_1040101 [Hymenopellis radicata]|nr:hypothetical protein BDZ89DRAFT_1040101 [Hymenopellis radicata]